MIMADIEKSLWYLMTTGLQVKQSKVSEKPLCKVLVCFLRNCVLVHTCMHACASLCVCMCACACAFMLHALNFDNMYL